MTEKQIIDLKHFRDNQVLDILDEAIDAKRDKIKENNDIAFLYLLIKNLHLEILSLRDELKTKEIYSQGWRD